MSDACLDIAAVPSNLAPTVTAGYTVGMGPHQLATNPISVPLSIGLAAFVVLLAGVGVGLARASRRGVSSIASAPDGWASSKTDTRLGAIYVYSNQFLRVTNSFHLILDGRDHGVFGRKRFVRVLTSAGTHELAVELAGRRTLSLSIDVAPGVEEPIIMFLDRAELARAPRGMQNVRGGLLLSRADESS